MIKYKIFLNDGSNATYTSVYVTADAGVHGIMIKYSTGTTIFYPYTSIKYFRIEEVNDDADED